MKKLLTAMILFSLPSLARAASSYVPSLVYEVAGASITCTTVTVSTSAATQMDSKQLAGRVSISIQNIDSSANLWCLPTNAPATNAGEKILPNQSWVIAIKDVPWLPYGTTPFRFWCLSDGASSTKAEVCQAN